MMIALQNIDDITLIDIRSIKDPMKIFANIITDFAYSVIDKIPTEDFSMKDFCTFFMRFEISKISPMETKLGDKWQTKYKNIALLKDNSAIHFQMFI